MKEKINDGDIDDSSLIFCFDISGSMSQSYDVGSELKEKFYKIREKNIKKKKNLIFPSTVLILTIIVQTMKT
jgi:hypothetical protein